MPHLRGVLPGLEEAQRGLIPEQQVRRLPSVLEHQYPAARDFIRRLREAGIQEAAIAEMLSTAEQAVTQEFEGKLTPAEIGSQVLGRQTGALQRIAATAFGAAGGGFIQDPIGRQAAGEATGLERIAGGAIGTLPLLLGAQGAIARIPALAARPILSGAATGAAFGAGAPLLEGEQPTVGGVLGSAALFGAFGALAGRRPLPGTKPPPAEPAQPRLPLGEGPALRPGAEGVQMQMPFEPPPGGLRGPGPLGGGELGPGGLPPLAGPPLTAAIRQAEAQAPAWVQDTFTKLSPIAQAERRPAEDVLKFAARDDELLTLNMGVNPFALFSAAKEPIGKVLRGLLGEGGEDIAAALRQAPQTKMFSRLVTRLHAFRDTAFLERLQPARFAARDIVIRFSNLRDEIVQPLSKAERTGPLIEALNSEVGYNSAEPGIRAVADRLRGEVFDPLFDLLATTAGVRGREGLRHLPFYYRHVLDRPETMKFLQQAARDFRSQGLTKQAAEMDEMLRAFAVRGNAALLADEDASRLIGANMRDFFREVPPGEAGFGAIERRLANLPTFSRDFDMVTDSYIRGASRKIAFDPILKDLAGDIAVLGGPLRERAVRLMRDFLGMRHPGAEAFDGMMRKLGLKLHDMFGVHPLAVAERFRAEDVSRMALQFQYLRLLYGNAGGALVNATQTPMNTFPLLAQKYGGKEGASRVIQGMRLAFTEEGRRLSREIIGRGGVTSALEGRPALERLVGYGDLFGFVETGFNQRVAGIAEYMALTARGMEHGAAVKAARQFVDKTQFFLDPLRRPEILSGPFGKVMGQFQSFKLNQLDFFLNELDKTGKGYFLGMLAAIGGPSAMPFIGPWLQRQAKPGGVTEGVDIGAGLPGLAGLDIARRVNPLESTARAFETGRPEAFLGRLAQSVLGPTPGAALGLFEGIWRFANAAPHAGAPTALWYAAEPLLREIEPVLATRAAQAAEIAATGQIRAGRPSGLTAGARALGLPVPPVRFGGASLGLQAAPGEAIPPGLAAGLGVPTQRQRELDVLVQQQRQAVVAAQAQRQNIVTAYLHFKATGDGEALREAIRAAPGVNVRRILLELERPAQARLMQRTPRRFRGQEAFP